MAGLRERWRRNAMRTIRARALDLFDERGFGAVTIEEIAAAAEVSPSSVYRYFGTKEGLVVADEFHAMSEAELDALLDPADPVGSLLSAVLTYEAEPADPSTGTGRPDPTGRRRARYFFTEPSVRRALHASLDSAAQRVAPILATRHDLSRTQARVAANALAFGYFGALEQWYLDGGERPIAEYVDEGLAPLRSLWS